MLGHFIHRSKDTTSIPYTSSPFRVDGVHPSPKFFDSLLFKVRKWRKVKFVGWRFGVLHFMVPLVPPRPSHRSREDRRKINVRVVSPLMTGYKVKTQHTWLYPLPIYLPPTVNSRLSSRLNLLSTLRKGTLWEFIILRVNPPPSRHTLHPLSRSLCTHLSSH